MDISTIKLIRKEIGDRDDEKMDTRIEEHEKGIIRKGCMKLTDYMAF